MKSTLPRSDKIDQLMRRRFWDAEAIVRDGESPAYSVFPSEPRDVAVAAAVGATIVQRVKNPLLIWVNNTEET